MTSQINRRRETSIFHLHRNIFFRVFRQRIANGISVRQPTLWERIC